MNVVCLIHPKNKSFYSFQKKRKGIYSFYSFLMFFCSFTVSCFAQASQPFQSIREDFPKGGDASYKRLAVFIGIDQYPKIKGGNLDGGVNDVLRLKELFVERFDFKRYALLTNAEATRQGIGKVFKSLVEQVKFAKTQTAKPISEFTDDRNGLSVVICYSGHGSQVKDQNGDEEDGKDETWIAHDSSKEGENDIRDDELQALYTELAKLDAQVVIISDSCHSGTLHRAAPFAKIRTIQRPTDKPVPGPQDNLFPDFTQPQKTRGGEAEPLPGFVTYTACLDTQFASEYKDETGTPCGKFNYILHQILPTMDPQISYQELYDKISYEFIKRGFDRTQTPQFHASSSKAHETFLFGGGQPVPIYAEIRPGTQDGKRVELTIGSLHGVTEQSTFIFYNTLDDLRKGQNELVRGEAKEVSPLTCWVELNEDIGLHRTVKAKLESVKMIDYMVFPGENLPDMIQAKLIELVEKGSLSLGTPDNYTVAVYYNPEEKTLGIYPPEALPNKVTGAGGQSIRTVNAEDLETGSKLLAENLFYLARVSRLMALEHDDGKIKTDLVTQDKELKPVARPKTRGFIQFQDKDRFKLKFKNETSKSLYVNIFYIPPDSTKKIELFYPEPEEERRPVKPGEECELTDVIIEVDADEDAGRSQIKIIATSVDMDFAPLIDEPSTGMDERTRAKIRGADNPLYDLISDVLYGGSKRSAKRVMPDMTWATSSLVFTVETP